MHVQHIAVVKVLEVRIKRDKGRGSESRFNSMIDKQASRLLVELTKVLFLNALRPDFPLSVDATSINTSRLPRPAKPLLPFINAELATAVGMLFDRFLFSHLPHVSQVPLIPGVPNFFIHILFFLFSFSLAKQHGLSIHFLQLDSTFPAVEAMFDAFNLANTHKDTHELSSLFKKLKPIFVMFSSYFILGVLNRKHLKSSGSNSSNDKVPHIFSTTRAESSVPFLNVSGGPFINTFAEIVNTKTLQNTPHEKRSIEFGSIAFHILKVQLAVDDSTERHVVLLSSSLDTLKSFGSSVKYLAVFNSVKLVG